MTNALCADLFKKIPEHCLSWSVCGVRGSGSRTAVVLVVSQ